MVKRARYGTGIVRILYPQKTSPEQEVGITRGRSISLCLPEKIRDDLEIFIGIIFKKSGLAS
jgi:hypothetical protein